MALLLLHQSYTNNPDERFHHRNLSSFNFTNVNINNNLFTKNIIDPDILIRTGNTQRLSNFMLWQLAYTEIFFEKKLWPDFKSNDFKKILNKFKSIKRNFGSI
mgnify:CR=1 FL=1